MSDCPEPFVAPDANLRGFDKLMLDVNRLLASELWAISTGDEFKAAIGLWCRAWQQIPAGSLPNDERVLSAFSGAGKSWPKVREVALRGFVLCADGRLYHRVLCEDVNRALALQASRKGRTQAATEARRKQRDDYRNDERDDERDVDVTEDVTTNVTRVQGHRRSLSRDIKPEDSQLPRVRAALVPAGGPSKEWKKSRWEQKICTEISRIWPPDQAIAAIESYQRGEEEGRRIFNDIDRSLKSSQSSGRA